MNFDERTTLFDKLYQDYILSLDEKQSSKRVAANYRKIVKRNIYIILSLMVAPYLLQKNGFEICAVSARP